MKMETTEWAVEAEGISYSYEGDGNRALDGLNLKIRRGKKVAVMGGNGSGKSTFFLCLNGIIRPDSGTIRINGSPLSYHRKGLLDVRSKVGIVFQEPDSQLFSASVFEDISFGVLNQGKDRDTARREVEDVIRELGIASFQDRPVHALSGGQKKQAAIAGVLAMHPEIILLDEPAAALDTEHRMIVNQIVESLPKKGITVLMATHDMDHAYEWADEILVFAAGRVAAAGTPDEICSDRKLLERCGLELPAAYRIYEAVRKRGMLNERPSPPRSIGELEEWIAGKAGTESVR